VVDGKRYHAHAPEPEKGALDLRGELSCAEVGGVGVHLLSPVTAAAYTTILQTWRLTIWRAEDTLARQSLLNTLCTAER
jgi:hypothetical protein